MKPNKYYNRTFCANNTIKKNLAREDTRLPFPLKELVVTKWTFFDQMIP